MIFKHLFKNILFSRSIPKIQLRSFSILDRIKMFTKKKETEEPKKTVSTESKDEKVKNIQAIIPPSVSKEPSEILVESKEKKPDKKLKYPRTKGPQLYISKMIFLKGPMSAKQIWNEYSKDEEAKESNLFRSRRFFIKKVIKTMYRCGKLFRAGYSEKLRTFFGYQVYVPIAFKNFPKEEMEKLEDEAKITTKIYNFDNEELTQERIVKKINRQVNFKKRVKVSRFMKSLKRSLNEHFAKKKK